MLLSFLAIVFVFGLIVLVHEWGHMMAAKACGVAVPDFAIGMGPSIASFRLGDTRYHLCLLPIGGFVRISGLEGDDALPRTKSELQKLERDASELPADLGADRSAALPHGEVLALNANDTELAAVEPAAAMAVAEQRERVVEHAVEDASNPELREGRWRTWRDINGWQKAFILVAGAAMNFLLALIVVFVMGLTGFPDSAVMISGVTPDSPAAAAGLKAGDIVLQVNGQRVSNGGQFIAVVNDSANEAMALTVRRGEGEVSLKAIPEVIEGYNEGRASLGVTLENTSDMTNEINMIQPKSLVDEPLTDVTGEKFLVGVGDRVVAFDGETVSNGFEVITRLAQVDLSTGEVMEPMQNPVLLTFELKNGTQRTVEFDAQTSMITLGLGFKPELHKLPFADSLKRSLQDAQALTLGMLAGMKMLVSSPDAEKMVSGPIGIVRIIGQSANSDLYSFLMILMVINLNLGLINLMPIPALDGGRLVFVALNGLGIRIHEKREALVHAMGMIMLLGLILLISIGDVMPLIKRGLFQLMG